MGWETRVWSLDFRFGGLRLEEGFGLEGSVLEGGERVPCQQTARPEEEIVSNVVLGALGFVRFISCIHVVCEGTRGLD